jgi:magnesium-transporting ATPase (P-type)
MPTPGRCAGKVGDLYLAENRRLGEQGLRMMATARKDLDQAVLDPGADLLPLVTGLELLALVGIVDPPRPPPGHRSRPPRPPASPSG